MLAEHRGTPGRAAYMRGATAATHVHAAAVHATSHAPTAVHTSASAAASRGKGRCCNC